MIGTAIQLTDFDLDIEVKRDTSGQIIQGLNIGPVTAQNQAVILICHKGELKEQPAVGVGISDMCLDHNPLAWRTKIREQLEFDGQNVEKVTITNSGISIDADY